MDLVEIWSGHAVRKNNLNRIAAVWQIIMLMLDTIMFQGTEGFIRWVAILEFCLFV